MGKGEGCAFSAPCRKAAAQLYLSPSKRPEGNQKGEGNRSPAYTAISSGRGGLPRRAGRGPPFRREGARSPVSTRDDFPGSSSFSSKFTVMEF
jgi:hypothetical protein